MDTYFANLFDEYQRAIIEEEVTFDELSDQTSFPIYKTINTGTSEIIYSSLQDKQKYICFKRLLPTHPEIFKSTNLVDRNKYIIEGYNLNAHFSPNIYLGIMKET